MNPDKLFRRGLMFAAGLSMLVSPDKASAQTPPRDPSPLPDIVCLQAPDIGPHWMNGFIAYPGSTNFKTSDGGVAFVSPVVGYVEEKFEKDGPHKGQVRITEGCSKPAVEGRCQPGETLATRIRQGSIFRRPQN